MVGAVKSKTLELQKESSSRPANFLGFYERQSCIDRDEKAALARTKNSGMNTGHRVRRRVGSKTRLRESWNVRAEDKRWWSKWP